MFLPPTKSAREVAASFVIGHTRRSRQRTMATVSGSSVGGGCAMPALMCRASCPLGTPNTCQWYPAARLKAHGKTSNEQSNRWMAHTCKASRKVIAALWVPMYTFCNCGMAGVYTCYRCFILSCIVSSRLALPRLVPAHDGNSAKVLLTLSR